MSNCNSRHNGSPCTVDHLPDSGLHATYIGNGYIFWFEADADNPDPATVKTVELRKRKAKR